MRRRSRSAAGGLAYRPAGPASACGSCARNRASRCTRSPDVPDTSCADISRSPPWRDQGVSSGSPVPTPPYPIYTCNQGCPVGHRPDNPDYMYKSGKEVWAPELLKTRPDLSMEAIEKYLHNLYWVRPDFVYRVTRDFVRNCPPQMLVLPDDPLAHPLQTAIDIASLAPNAEITVFPWKEPPELKERTINRVRSFLKRHQPQTAAR